MAAMTRFGGKALTDALRKLSTHVIEVGSDDSQTTRIEKLALLIWNQALGSKTEIRDAEGNLQTIEVKPVAWAQQFLWERLEGKAPLAMVEDTGGIKASEKVRELSRDRINRMTAKVLAPVASGPPKYKPKAR